MVRLSSATQGCVEGRVVCGVVGEQPTTSEPVRGAVCGVSDGGRTRDNRDHNPVLYQLSYTHHVQAPAYRGRARAYRS